MLNVQTIQEDLLTTRETMGSGDTKKIHICIRHMLEQIPRNADAWADLGSLILLARAMCDGQKVFNRNVRSEEFEYILDTHRACAASSKKPKQGFSYADIIESVRSILPVQFVYYKKQQCDHQDGEYRGLLHAAESLCKMIYDTNLRDHYINQLNFDENSFYTYCLLKSAFNFLKFDKYDECDDYIDGYQESLEDLAAELYSDSSEYDKANELLMLALFMDPEHSGAQAELGYAMNRGGYMAKARRSLRKAVQMNGKRGFDFLCLSNTCWALNEDEAAAVAFRKGCILTPPVYYKVITEFWYGAQE